MHMLFEHSYDGLDWADHSANSMIPPFVEVVYRIVDRGTALVHTPEAFSNSPGLRGFQVHLIYLLESAVSGRFVRVFQPERSCFFSTACVRTSSRRVESMAFVRY